MLLILKIIFDYLLKVKFKNNLKLNLKHVNLKNL